MKTTNPQMLILGIKGKVLAFDPTSGRELWRTDLTGADFVNVLMWESQVIAATRGELFCLDKRTGKVLWHDPLKGLGRGLITLATAEGSTPGAVLAEKLAQDQAQGATAASSASVVAAS